MARSWTSYEEVTPHEPVDGRDNNQTYYDDDNNNDNSRSRPRGNSRKYLCTCLIALLAVFGVLVGTYFVLDHYQKLPSSLQFTKPPPTAAPIAYQTKSNRTSSPTAVSILPPSGNFTDVNSTLAPTIAPPSSDLSVYCSEKYIEGNTDLECSAGCKPGQCCSAQNEMDSCLEANMATCKLYSACKVLLASTSATNTSSSVGSGTTNSTEDTATIGSLAAPTEDLSSICSQDYLDANTNLECMSVCLPAQCCMQSAKDSCLMDNLETCLMYQPCTILTKEDSSTSNSTTTTGNPPLEYLPEGLDTTETTNKNQTDLLLNNTEDATSTLPMDDMNSTGLNETSATTADGMNELNDTMSSSSGEFDSTTTMPSGMLPPEGFNDTMPTLNSYCGKSFNNGSDPVCSTTICTSDEECFDKSTKYPVCLASCGPSASSAGGNGKNRYPAN